MPVLLTVMKKELFPKRNDDSLSFNRDRMSVDEKKHVPTFNRDQVAVSAWN